MPPAKNAVLPLLAASAMVQGKVTLLDVPDLSDIRAMLGLLQGLGVKVTTAERTVTIDATEELKSNAVLGTSAMRSSLFLLGPLLARGGVAELGYPGGCVIGKRPIDIHLDGLRALGVMAEEREDRIVCYINGEVKGAYRLPYPSVGATVNLICLATRSNSPVTLLGFAKEPEVSDLIRFLRALGVMIEVEGDRLTVMGRATGDVVYRPIADRIWAGTMLGAVAVTGGEVVLHGINGQLLADWTAKIANKCCKITTCCDTMRVSACKEHPARHFVTAPYPGFATDLMAMAVVYNATASGMGLVKETVFEDRFGVVGELAKMGLKASIVGDTAILHGGVLHGAHVKVPDLRAGAALVVAGLAAKGETVVEGVHLIDRGYERLHDTLAQLGADIVRMDER